MYPTPCTCVECGAAICLHCKQKNTGASGIYYCKEHSGKPDLTDANTSTELLQPSDSMGADDGNEEATNTQSSTSKLPNKSKERTTKKKSSDGSIPLVGVDDGNEEAANSQSSTSKLANKSKERNPQKKRSKGSISLLGADEGNEEASNSQSSTSKIQKKTKKGKNQNKGSNGPISLLDVHTDRFLEKNVAYDISSDVGKSISSNFRCTVSSSTLRRNHLLGTVTRRMTARGGAGQLVYQVAWRNSQYGTSEMVHPLIHDGIENYNRLQLLIDQSGPATRRRSEMSNRVLDPYANSSAIALMVQNSLQGDPSLSPCPSESEEEEDDKSINSNEDIDKYLDSTSHMDRTKCAHPEIQDEDPLLVSDDEEDCQGNVDDIVGLEWVPNLTLPPKAGKMLPTPSSIKAEYIESKFDTPVSSFLAFLPTRMWEKICYESNTHAHQKMQQSQRRTICGNYWRKDIDVQEMMQFVGLLIQMTLQPLPGRDYRYYWSENKTFSWVDCMSITRFKQIRSCLHFNRELSPGEKSSDPLQKIRPVYATIQDRIGRFTQLGSEFSLDEASAACRSAYGRHLIVFNPMKNCGKFHFRFYLLCCSSTYVCVKLRIHVKTDEMVEDDKFVSESTTTDGVEEVGSTKVLNQLVMDMARPLYGKGITLNFNNYYASPAIAIQLLGQTVFCRGTLRKNKRLIPKYILFSKSEAKGKDSRGAVKIAVNLRFQLVAVGWIDGNPVHMISSADTAEVRKQLI